MEVLTMNKNQKAFLNSLLKTIQQAQQTQASLREAMEIGVANKAACKQYVQALQSYIDDARRMTLECTIAYGKGSDIIATEGIVRGNLEN